MATTVEREDVLTCSPPLAPQLVQYAKRGGLFVPAAALGSPSAATSCPCKIRFTLLNETSSGSHKFKLVSLMSGFYTGTIVSDAVGWAARYGVM